jgi:hypothetical protein
MTITTSHYRPAAAGRVTHLDTWCIVTQHDHSWQPARFPRCSCWFWCATHREWFHGGRCPGIGQGYGLPKPR